MIASSSVIDCMTVKLQIFWGRHTQRLERSLPARLLDPKLHHRWADTRKCLPSFKRRSWNHHHWDDIASGMLYPCNSFFYTKNKYPGDLLRVQADALVRTGLKFQGNDVIILHPLIGMKVWRGFRTLSLYL